MLRLTRGHFLFMGIGPVAGLAVLTDTGANLGMVAQQMNRLVDATEHLLTRQMRDDLRHHAEQRSSWPAGAVLASAAGRGPAPLTASRRGRRQLVDAAARRIVAS